MNIIPMPPETRMQVHYLHLYNLWEKSHYENTKEFPSYEEWKNEYLNTKEHK